MLKSAAIFSDHMVLQRNKKICIFGEGISGRIVSVTLGEDKASNKCRDGKWMVYLPEREAGENLHMEISDGKETICFEDVAVGEVWLAGGQSNMELELKDADEGACLLKEGIPESVRYYYTPKLAYKDEAYGKIFEESHWELFNEKDGAKWSAVGVFFARKLAARLNVTVGIVGCNWGGTSASCWMGREMLLWQDETRSYVEEYDALDLVRKPEGEQIKEYQESLRYQEEWDQKAAKVYEKEPMISFDKVQ